MEPGFRNTHTEQCPMPVTTDSSSRPKPVNTGSRTSSWTQAPVMIPSYASTRLVHLLTQAAHLHAQGFQQQTCPQKSPDDPLRISGQAHWWRTLPAEACCKDWKRCLFPQMCRHQHKTTDRIMNNQRNMIPQKEINQTVITYTEEIEVYELSAKEFIIILLKNFNELQRTKWEVPRKK